MNLLGFMVAFLSGLVIGLIDYRISCCFIRKKPDFLVGANIIHQFIALIFLIAVYFIAPLTPFSRIAMLFGAVIGITVMIVFTTLRLLKISSKIDSDTNESNTRQKEEDKNG